MSRSPLVRSRSEFDTAASDLLRVVDLNARLPDSPFHVGGVDSPCEFERFRAGTFSPFLARLAEQYGDEYVSGLSVDPDSDYFQKYYQSFGAFRIPATEIASGYWAALSYQPNDDITGELFFAADILCVAGSSGSWAVWGERELGVAIVRTVGSDHGWRAGADIFAAPEVALSDFVEPNFNRSPMPDSFRRRFLRNFRSTEGPRGTPTNSRRVIDVAAPD